MADATIVVVDDSEIALDFARDALEEAGFKVFTESNPMLVPGLLRLRKPQLLLLDVDMPGLEGPKVLEILRRNDCLSATKVVFFSARPDSELKELAGTCGALGSISKTIEPEMLAHKVSKHLRSSSSGRVKVAGREEGNRALVFAADPELEQSVLSELERLGYCAHPRGSVGIDRALREESTQLLVLDELAFPGRLPTVLDRLQSRALLKGVGVVVLGGGSPPARGVSLQPNQLGGLANAVRRAHRLAE